MTSLHAHPPALRRSLALVIGLGLVASLVLAACGSQEIPAHPINEVTDRVRQRIERIVLVVPGRERADAVTDTYLELEKLLFAYYIRRDKLKSELSSLKGHEPDVEARIHDILTRRMDMELAMGERYVALQMQIRSQVTESEFESIDKLR